MKIRNIGKIKQIVEEATGLDITHLYDDLVFVDQSPFMIAFDDNDQDHFFCYFSIDCPPEERVEIYRKLCEAAKRNAMRCTGLGSFELQAVKDKEELEIRFFK